MRYFLNSALWTAPQFSILQFSILNYYFASLMLLEVEGAGIHRLACDSTVDAELFQADDILKGGHAAGRDDLTGDRGAQRRQLVKVRTCEHAVLVNVSEDDVAYAMDSMRSANAM